MGAAVTLPALGRVPAKRLVGLGLLARTALMASQTALTPVANFSGIVNAQLVRAQVFSGTVYSPGVGNLI